MEEDICRTEARERTGLSWGPCKMESNRDEGENTRRVSNDKRKTFCACYLRVEKFGEEVYSVCVIIGKNDDVKVSFARQKVW